MKAYKIIILISLFSCSLQAPWWGLQSALAFFAKFQFPKIQLSDEYIDKWVNKAIEHESIQGLKHLLSLKKSDGKECNVNNILVGDRTAIHYAAWVNNYQMCELLLKAGANPNTPRKANFNRTPIWTAVQNKNFSLAQLFINYGANINHNGDDDGHLSAFCIINQSLICVQSLLALKKKDGSRALDVHQTSKGNGPLTIAAQENVNSVDKAKVFLEAGADVNQRNQITPIWNAVGNGSLEMTQLLIEHGADINLPDENNKSLMAFAYLNIKNNDLSIFEEILARRPTNINHTDSNGKALLSCIATNQKVHGQIGLRLIKMMLAAGAHFEKIRGGP